jgi:hypothetical protein
MPEVLNFPRFAENSNLAAHTFFKPSNYLNAGLKNVVSPAAIDLGLDDLLRKFIPDMPYDPSFIRNNGMLGLLTQSEKARAGKYHVNLGNLEKGRPVLTNSAEWSADTWNQQPDKYEFMKKIMEKKSAAEFDAELVGILRKVFKNRLTGFKRGVGGIGAVLGGAAGTAGTAVEQLMHAETPDMSADPAALENNRHQKLKNILVNGLIGAGAGGAIGAGTGAYLRNRTATKTTNQVLKQIDDHYINSYRSNPAVNKNQFLENTLLEVVKNKDKHSFLSALFKKKPKA